MTDRSDARNARCLSLPATLATLAILTALPASLRGEPAPDGYEPPAETSCGPAAVPMKDWGGRAAVEAWIGDHGPYVFHVDTGTPFAALLSSVLIEELGLETSPIESAEDEPRDGGRLDELRLGDATFRGVPFAAFDFAAFGSAHAPAGVLGLPLFESCLLTLDHPAREIRLATGALAADEPDVVAYRPDPAHGTFVTVPIELAGHRLEAHLDTGSPGEVTLLERMAERLPLQGPPVEIGRARTPGGEATISSAVLDGDLVLAGHRFPRPRLAFADLGPMLASGVGNVGSGLMRQFAVTLDQANRRARFERPAASTPSAGSDRVVQRSSGRHGIGAMLAASPDALVVDGLVPGGAAEADGLRPGDRIVAVDGRPIGELAPEALRSVFGAPDPVRLTVERDGATLELTVTPRPR